MGKFANERAWRESRAWSEPEPQEPMTDDEFEIEYSEYAWDRIDAEASGKRVGEWHGR